MAKVTAAGILEDAKRLKEEKQKDYQGHVWSEEDYFPFDDYSYIHMLWTKMLRIRSLAENPDNPNFESLQDSVIDLINYGAMYAAFLENRDMK